MSAPRWDQATWFKSTRSATNGACVEVALVGRSVGVRDSKSPSGGMLEFPAEAWTELMNAINEGRFDK